MLDEERFRKPETTDDIIREMRDLGALDEQCGDMIPRSLQALGLRTYAGRLEAARKRETDNAAMREACRMLNDEGDDTLCEKLKCPWYGEPNGCNSPSGEYQTAKSSGFGNAVAMHSCLVKILAEMLDLCGMKVGQKACFAPGAVAEEIRAALAVPPRNCDVWTAEEQQERFREFCRRHEAAGECGIGSTQAKCPCWRGPKNPDCALAWSQMPYEAGGAR